ncbi:hypothetical protein V6N11_066675 [Hibiscus sabdariffa]|uniref:Uncharacterized protein n=1 Tax=Hibiscus sabdariffa TaxID=183260 RepID=A0ABR2AH07_9ROSI
MACDKSYFNSKTKKKKIVRLEIARIPRTGRHQTSGTIAHLSSSYLTSDITWIRMHNYSNFDNQGRGRGQEIKENGLKKKLVKKVEGSETPKDGDEVEVHNTGTLLDRGKGVKTLKHRYREVGGRVIVRNSSENRNIDIETVDFGGGGAISERKAGVRVKKGRNKDKEKGSRNEHLTDAVVDAAANWTEVELPPHFRVMVDSFDVRLATMQSHFDGRLNEISNQQSVIQTEVSEIRRHLNDKFDILFVAVGNRSEDLSTSKAPTAQ